MTKGDQGKERRKFFRVAEEDLLIYEPFDTAGIGGSTAGGMQVFTKDLSEGGVLFEASELFEIGDLLKLQLDIPGWEKYTLDLGKEGQPPVGGSFAVVAKVVRIEDVGGGFFDIGVAFVAFEPGHKAALKKYLERQA